MPILRVANVHFDSTATNRLDYLGDSIIRLSSPGGAVSVITGNLLVNRTDSTLGNGNKLDVAGSANASQYYINGTLATAIANSYADIASTGANNYSNATFVKLGAALQTIQGDLTVTGNLITQGNSVIVNSQSLNVVDPLIYLAGNNYSSDVMQIGFVGNYKNTTGNITSHTGFIRDYTTKEYYIFNEYNQEPSNNWINISGNNFTLAVLNGTIRTSNLILGGANAITSIAASNVWTNTVFGYSNTYTQSVGSVGNNYVNTVFGYTNTSIAGANSWTNTVFGYVNTAIAGSNTWTNNVFGYANTKFLSNDRVNFAYTGNVYVSTGNVLVGRTADSTAGQSVKLDVAGAINASSLLINGAAPTYGATIYQDAVATSRYMVFVDSTSGTMSKANVDVNLIYNPSTYVLTAVTFNSTSDINKKENIKIIDNSIYKVSQLNGVTFNWKDNGLSSAGLIAQDVEKVLPCLVDENKNLNYDGLIGLLVECIKNLNKKIEIMEKKIDGK